MIIQDENLKIEFKVLGYQFPNIQVSKKDDFDYDANWLTIQVSYQSKTECNVYRDSCLMTNELENIVRNMECILKSTETAFISECMEPYFKFAVSKTYDNFVLILYFVYDVLDDKWQTFTVSETVSREKLIDIKEELQQYLNCYPQR